MAKRNDSLPDFDQIEAEFNPADSPINVADWTAEDYSKFFVRYRPRLQAYASSFLKDKTEVDEVVQDAFLYLFMSLPELDSELAVLRYLKWKTRLLALDLLRARGRRPALFEVPEDAESLAGSEAGPDEFLNDVDDAAIVHMALARIPDRHREVLIRAEFEEASAREIGENLGISENAARQLLHRARRAFREQLALVVGESDATISSFLSTAVRKAKEAGVKGAVMMLLIAVPAIGIGMLYRGTGSPYQSYLSATAGDALIAPDITVNKPATKPTDSTTKPNVKPVSKPAAQRPAPAATEAAVELSSFVDPNITFTGGASAAPSADGEFGEFQVQGTNVSADVFVHQYAARLDVSAYVQVVVDGTTFGFDSNDLIVSRSFSADGRSLILEFDVDPILLGMEPSVAAKLPGVIHVKLVVDRSLSTIRDASIVSLPRSDS